MQRTNSGMHTLAQLVVACKSEVNLLGVCASHFLARDPRCDVLGMAAIANNSVTRHAIIGACWRLRQPPLPPTDVTSSTCSQHHKLPQTLCGH